MKRTILASVAAVAVLTGTGTQAKAGSYGFGIGIGLSFSCYKQPCPKDCYGPVCGYPGPVGGLLSDAGHALAGMHPSYGAANPAAQALAYGGYPGMGYYPTLPVNPAFNPYFAHQAALAWSNPYLNAPTSPYFPAAQSYQTPVVPVSLGFGR